MFSVLVACDFGSGKLNTKIEFRSVPPPASLADIVAVVEVLYTAELRVQTGDSTSEFHCAVLLLLVDVYQQPANASGASSSNATSEQQRKGRWVEVTSIDQIPNGAQLFAFDTNSPPPTRGTIPRAQLIVDAGQVLSAHRSSLTGVPHAAASAASGSLVMTPPGPATHTAAVHQQGQHRTPYVQTSAHHPQRRTTISSGTAGAAGPSTSPPPSAAAQGPQVPRATAEDRDALFQQLCIASASATATLSNNSNAPQTTIAAPVLFTVLTDNGLSIPADQFTDITGGTPAISRGDWNYLCEQFGPLIDVLYFRLAAKASRNQNESSLIALRDHLRELEDEEHRLLIRHATLREEIARATRDVREEEERMKRVEVDSDRRNSDTTMVQKFVSLRVRQMRLKREEEQISKELMLL